MEDSWRLPVSSHSRMRKIALSSVRHLIGTQSLLVSISRLVPISVHSVGYLLLQRVFLPKECRSQVAALWPPKLAFRWAKRHLPSLAMTRSSPLWTWQRTAQHLAEAKHFLLGLRVNFKLLLKDTFYRFTAYYFRAATAFLGSTEGLTTLSGT